MSDKFVKSINGYGIADEQARSQIEEINETLGSLSINGGGSGADWIEDFGQDDIWTWVK